MSSPQITLQQALEQASAYQQSGYLKEAERLYRAILQARADEPTANHNLGVLLCAVGDFTQALPLLRRAVATHPLAARHWLSYLDALLRSKNRQGALVAVEEARARGLPAAVLRQLEARLDEEKNAATAARPSRTTNDRRNAAARPSAGTAPTGQATVADQQDLQSLLALYNQKEFERSVERAKELLERFPDNGYIWKILSASLFALGRKVELVASAQRAADLLATDPQNHNNLAAALKDVSRSAEAEASARRALELDPNFADAHANLASILIDLGKHAEAEASARKAAQLKPSLAAAHNNLGLALIHLGVPAQAEGPLTRAVELSPLLAEAHCNLGHAYTAMRKNVEAEAAYARAIELKPDFIDALLGIAEVESNLWRHDEAEKHCRLALELATPGSANEARTLFSLGHSLLAQARVEEAAPVLDNATKTGILAPESILTARLSLPLIPSSVEQIDHWRTKYQAGIEELQRGSYTLNTPTGVHQNTFYLAYHDRDDRQIMELLGRVLRAKAPVLSGPKPRPLIWPRPRRPRIRVGILSMFFHGHTIGKLFAGMLYNLDRERFEPVLLRAAGSKTDRFAHGMDEMADKVVDLDLKDLRGQQDAIVAEELDVLLYPDIGMSYTYYLAFARLAPVQIVSWGHPDTTGLETVDYFLSADSIEPPGADALYTERLVRLSRLPSFYVPFAAPSLIPTRAALGLPEHGTLYGCPQSTFKLHPDFDKILEDIARGDPDGHIVMLAGLSNPWKGVLLKRWAQQAPLLLERVLFLPQRPLEGFMALMAHFDVVLDPIHFGSGNTLYEAMAYGTPIVTWPGRFMRGRIVAGAYRQMGVEEAPIAQRLEDYAPLALSIGTDPEKRQALRLRLLEASARELFGDMRAIREIEEFLEEAVAAAAAGTRLAVGWRPSHEPIVTKSMS